MWISLSTWITNREILQSQTTTQVVAENKIIQIRECTNMINESMRQSVGFSNSWFWSTYVSKFHQFRWWWCHRGGCPPFRGIFDGRRRFDRFGFLRIISQTYEESKYGMNKSLPCRLRACICGNQQARSSWNTWSNTSGHGYARFEDRLRCLTSYFQRQTLTVI